MQPYIFPYIGYFQLISAVDEFVVYDNIKYTKRGWINRNRFLLNGQSENFSIPLEKASDYATVVQRKISEGFNPDKLINKFKGAYLKAPYYNETQNLLSDILYQSDRNLFNFTYNSLTKICRYLNITTKMTISSDVKVDHNLRSQDKVISICNAIKANTYVNPDGGRELYEFDAFQKNGIKLCFIQPSLTYYKQFNHPFVPSLSIIDILMFNSLDQTRNMLKDYSVTGKVL